MNPAPSPAETVTNVETFPAPPRLRVVQKLAEAEADVVNMTQRVGAAIADAQAAKASKKADAPKRERKPRLKKPDPIVEQASKASDTQAIAQDAPGASLLETDPVADAQASAAGPALLLDSVVATALPPSAGDVSLREMLSRGFAWLVFGAIAVALLLAGAISAARASGNSNGPTCVGNDACPSTSSFMCAESDAMAEAIGAAACTAKD